MSEELKTDFQHVLHLHNFDIIRIIIPQGLVDLAKLEKDVVLTGAGKKVEIWSKERLDGETPEESMEDIVEKLSTEYGLKF